MYANAKIVLLGPQTFKRHQNLFTKSIYTELATLPSPHTHHTLTHIHTQLRRKGMIPLGCFICEYLYFACFIEVGVSLLYKFNPSTFIVIPDVFGCLCYFTLSFQFHVFSFVSFFLLSCLLFFSPFFLPVCKHSIILLLMVALKILIHLENTTLKVNKQFNMFPLNLTFRHLSYCYLELQVNLVFKQEKIIIISSFASSNFFYLTVSNCIGHFPHGLFFLFLQ